MAVRVQIFEHSTESQFPTSFDSACNVKLAEWCKCKGRAILCEYQSLVTGPIFVSNQGPVLSRYCAR